MTCIAGWIDPTTKSVFLGGDSLASNDIMSIQIGTRKVIHYGHMAIGFAGRVIVANALIHRFNPPPFKEGDDVEHYVNVKVVNELAKSLDACPWFREEEAHFEMLLGMRGRLYRISSDLSVIPLNEQFHSIGSGFMYTLGALTAFHQIVRDENGAPAVDPAQAVLLSLRAASRHQPGAVGGEIYVEEITFDGKPKLAPRRKGSKRSKTVKTRNRSRTGKPRKRPAHGGDADELPTTSIPGSKWRC